MRSLVLGAFILASLGISANAAESPSDAKAVGQHARRPACQMVTADRTLRLLRDFLPGQRHIATDGPANHPILTPVKGPVVKASRPVMPVHLETKPEPIRVASRPAPVRFVSRAEPVRLSTQHLSLMVGVSY
jgi:hypothetical protein